MLETTTPTGDESLKIGDLELHPITFAMLWLLEDLKHPWLAGKISEGDLGPRQVARAVFVFADVKSAQKIFDSAGADGVDKAAKEMAASLRFSRAGEIINWIMAQIASCVSEPPPGAETAEAKTE